MKKSLLMFLGVLMTLPTFAHDFTFTYGEHTLTYTVIDEAKKTCTTKSGVDFVAGNEVKGDLIIPSAVKDGDVEYTVTEIGEAAFYDCSDLTSVTIPNSVSVIGMWAFVGCSELTSISIPESVTEIGSYAFEDCSGLTEINVDSANKSYRSIDGVVFNSEETVLLLCPAGFSGSYTIPESVTEIGGSAFASCSKLTSITIPDSVTEIGNGAFIDCAGLTSVTIPRSVTEIAFLVFWRCAGLTSVTIPNSITKIDEMAFSECSSLESVTIPESVTTIGRYAFSECSSLTSVTIPGSVTEWGDKVFRDCKNLKDVYYSAESPIEAKSTLFTSTVYSNATLWVPENAVALCKGILPWGMFRNIKAYHFTEVEEVMKDHDFSASCAVYTIKGEYAGSTIEQLATGIYIVRRGDTVKKIAIK